MSESPSLEKLIIAVRLVGYSLDRHQSEHIPYWLAVHLVELRDALTAYEVAP